MMMSALPAGARLAARSGHTKARRLGDEGQVGVLEAELGDLKLGALGHMPLRTQKRKFSAYVYYSSSPAKSPCFRLSRDALPTTKEFDSHGSASASASGAADESRCDGRPTMEEETQNEPAVEPAVIVMFGGRAHVKQGAGEDEEEGEDEAEDGYEGEDEAAPAVAAAEEATVDVRAEDTHKSHPLLLLRSPREAILDRSVRAGMDSTDSEADGTAAWSTSQDWARGDGSESDTRFVSGIASQLAWWRRRASTTGRGRGGGGPRRR